MFIYTLLGFKQGNNLNKCNSDIETLTIEVKNDTKKNIIIIGTDRPPRGNEKIF